MLGDGRQEFASADQGDESVLTDEMGLKIIGAALSIAEAPGGQSEGLPTCLLSSYSRIKEKPPT
jgi:hypothetical protein